MDGQILERIYQVILERRDNPPEKSYVVSLLTKGTGKIGEKVMEEAGELVEAAGEDDHAHTVYEAADLVFHVLVLLADRGIRPEEVWRELGRRFGVSGIAEKEARKNNNAD
jgi:phosphoribosyl-ATP pyrophosphohydrolase